MSGRSTEDGISPVQRGLRTLRPGARRVDHDEPIWHLSTEHCRFETIAETGQSCAMPSDQMRLQSEGRDLSRTIRFFFGGVCAVAFIAAGMLSWHHEASIETATLIESSPATVWAILTATDDYPSWNPEITQLHGELRAGGVIEFVEGSGRDAMVFHPTILVVRPLQELRWKGHVWIPGLFDGEHRFVLETVGDKTRLIQGETFTGILAGIVPQNLLNATLASMQAMNSALKIRAERAAGR